MDKEISRDQIKFEIQIQGQMGGLVILPITKRRNLVGRGHACDIVVPFPDISTIHAVLEVSNNGTFKVYDLNSKNGTFVNGKRVVVEDLALGGTFSLGENTATIKKFAVNDMPPPPLTMLNALPPAISDNASALVGRPELPQTTPERASVAEIKSANTKPLPTTPKGLGQEEHIPQVQYPLAKDPRAEFSEYIFEDADHLYPIFKYDVGHSAVEVIIVFNDRIQSVDYLPTKDGQYFLTGKESSSKSVSFPYLGRDVQVPFIKIQNGEAEIYPMADYYASSLGDTKRDNLNNAFFLYDEEIVQFSKQHIQIFVRKTLAPPKVAPAPIFRRDSEFKKYLLLMLLLVGSFLGVFSNIEVDEDLEKEKAPERIATILYKRRPTVSKHKAIEKTPEEKKVVQKSPEQKKQVVKKTEPKKVEKADTSKVAVAKAGTKTATKVGPVKKATPNKSSVTVNKNTVNPVNLKKAGKASAQNRPKAASKAIANSKGAVDTYRSADFKSTVSNLISKGGGTKSATSVSDYTSGIRGSAISEASTGATLKTAKVSNNTGSLTGVAAGKLDASKGVEGLVDKKSIYTAGTPYKTVILGGLDPDVIRQILVENIPRFRYCYQKVLDRSKQAFNGIVKLNFIIGASGYVTKAGVDSVSQLPTTVKSCVVNVLRKISFPEPAGGGVVEVSQPMNFYPRVK